MQFYSPTKIFFHHHLMDCLRNLKDGNVLVISSKSAANVSGALDEVEDNLNALGHKFFFENTIVSNPTVQLIDDIRSKYQTKNIANIVSIGGGSVIDAGKALSICLSNSIGCSQILKTDYSKFSKLLHVAIPTTAGTGSETSKGAILSDYENEWKGGLRGENIFCEAAYLNPRYLRSMSIDLCLSTGFDAVSHAIETYLSIAATPLSKKLSISALELLIPDLLILSDSKSMKTLSLEQLGSIQLGSCIAGINLANSSTCLPHRLQYCIGSITDTAHVDGVALLYPAWLRNLRRQNVAKLNELNTELCRIAPALNIDEPILDLLERTGMLKTPSDLGLNSDMIKKLVSLASGSLKLDPGYIDENTIYTIFEDTLSCKQ